MAGSAHKKCQVAGLATRICEFFLPGCLSFSLATLVKGVLSGGQRILGSPYCRDKFSLCIIMPVFIFMKNLSSRQKSRKRGSGRGEETVSNVPAAWYKQSRSGASCVRTNERNICDIFHFLSFSAFWPCAHTRCAGSRLLISRRGNIWHGFCSAATTSFSWFLTRGKVFHENKYWHSYAQRKLVTTVWWPRYALTPWEYTFKGI